MTDTQSPTAAPFGLPELVPGPEILVEKAAPQDQRYWSVTTLIRVLDKGYGLELWNLKATARSAIRLDGDGAGLQRLVERRGEDWVVDQIISDRFWLPPGQRSASERGTALHTALEDYSISGIKPKVAADIQPYLDSFDAWAQRNAPSYQAAEMVVFSPRYKYAGQADAFLTLDGVPLIVDYKSAEDETAAGNPTRPYAEGALQLSAYRNADFAAVWRARRSKEYSRRYYLLSESERALAVPVPSVDGGAIVHITPRRCAAYAVRCDEEVFEAFLTCIDAAHWSFEFSRDVIGDVIERTR